MQVELDIVLAKQVELSMQALCKLTSCLSQAVQAHECQRTWQGRLLLSPGIRGSPAFVDPLQSRLSWWGNGFSSRFVVPKQKMCFEML